MAQDDLYARMFANAPTALVLLDSATGRVVQINAAFSRIVGRACTDIIGRRFWEPPLVADAHAGARIQTHLLAGGVVSGAELPLQTGDGRWLLVEVSGSAARGFVQLEVHDTTARELDRLAERHAGLRRMAERTASEFRNLHSALRTMGEVLLVGAGQGRPVLDEFEAIQQASERAGVIAGQLEAFSGGTTLVVQPTALNDLVQSMLSRLRQLFGREIEIVSDLSPDMPPVLADPMQVRQIIMKMAANSRDAIEGAGTFCLQTSTAIAIEPGLGIEHASSGPYGVLAVSDSGPGFDDQSWDHLYEPFFSTKGNAGNLGLGLPSVYGIVRKCGGRLWTYSQPGQGVTFRIYLPLAPVQFPALTSPIADQLPGNTLILLVEANDGMRTVMVNLFKRRGYRVLAALDSKEALRIADAQGPPDLLISRPAPDLAAQLTTRQPRLRVLYLCGYAESLAGREQGFPPRTALLAKPFEPDTLLAAVLDLFSQPL